MSTLLCEYMVIVSQLMINIVTSFALLFMVAVSFSLIYSSSRIFNLAHAAIMAVAAYMVLLFAFVFLFSPLLSVFFAILASILIGMLCEVLVFRFMRKRQSSKFAFLIASIGIYLILQNTISLYFGDETKIINTSKISIGHQIYGAYITSVQLITIFVSFVFFIGVNLFLNYTKTGKSIRAISSNPDLCNIYGISTNKIILIAFAIGSGLAGVTGILSAMDTNMTPTFGFNLLLYGVVAMIIGGVGSIRGLIAGSLLVGSAQNLAAFYLNTKWMDSVTYVILILFLIWKPLGFSGKKLKKVEV